jgi:hypothetical protein
LKAAKAAEAFLKAVPQGDADGVGRLGIELSFPFTSTAASVLPEI